MNFKQETTVCAKAATSAMFKFMIRRRRSISPGILSPLFLFVITRVGLDVRIRMTDKKKIELQKIPYNKAGFFPSVPSPTFS